MARLSWLWAFLSSPVQSSGHKRVQDLPRIPHVESCITRRSGKYSFDPSSDNNQGTDDEEASGNEENDSEEESSQAVDQEGETQNDTTNTQTVFSLISRVKAWHRFETSQY